MSSSVSDPQVFRIRRHQPTRLEGFIDSSFAFAVTLLVISIGHVPTSMPEMLLAMRGLPAFACSFLLIARFWKAHRDWSRHYDIEDNTSLSLSLLLVFTVLAFVYPLRFLFSLLFAWISDGYLADQPINVHSVDEVREAFQIYGIGFCTIALLFVLLYRHAFKQRVAVGLDAAEILATQMSISLWTAFGGVAVLSAFFATVLPLENGPSWLFSVPGMTYALISVMSLPIRRHYMRRIAALPDRATAAQ